jgi:hypothetical protein
MCKKNGSLQAQSRHAELPIHHHIMDLLPQEVPLDVFKGDTSSQCRDNAATLQQYSLEAFNFTPGI